MIQGQCTNGDDSVDVVENSAGPCVGLKDVMHHVPMAKHGALRQACRAAGVLQECNVREAKLDWRQRAPGCSLQCLFESDAARQGILRYRFPDEPQGEICKRPFWPAEQVSNARGNNMIDAGLVKHFFQRCREVFENDDAACAGIP